MAFSVIRLIGVSVLIAAENRQKNNQNEIKVILHNKLSTSYQKEKSARGDKNLMKVFLDSTNILSTINFIATRENLELATIQERRL